MRFATEARRPSIFGSTFATMLAGVTLGCVYLAGCAVSFLMAGVAMAVRKKT